MKFRIIGSIVMVIIVIVLAVVIRGCNAPQVDADGNPIVTEQVQ